MTRLAATIGLLLLLVSSGSAQTRKAEYRLADGVFVACGIYNYDVQPRGGLHAVVVIPETTSCPAARTDRYDANAATKKRAATAQEIADYDAEKDMADMRADLWRLRSKDVLISAVEVKTLRVSPKVLVAAPGQGYALQFVSAAIQLTYVAPGYAEAGDDLVVRYTDSAGVVVSETFDVTGFITAASSRGHAIGAHPAERRAHVAQRRAPRVRARRRIADGAGLLHRAPTLR